MARAARLLPLALALLFLAATTSTARVPAATTPVSRTQILQALGVERVPADYVILVDTSGSMQQDNRYERTKQALRSLLATLDPQDHLSLVTFDTSPTIRYTKDVSSAPEQAVARLPDEPKGQFTDIGAAIGTALREFERPDEAAVGTMLLLTDGRHEPPAGSPYPATAGQAWTALTDRAQALRRQHRLNAYAIGLGNTAQTDAHLLGQVVPGAEVLALPPDELSSYLQRIKVFTSLEKAKSLLAPEKDATVTVSWPRDQLVALEFHKGRARVAVTLHSTLKHVPLELRNLSLVSSGFPVRVDDVSPRQVSLPPGGTKALDLDVSFPQEGGFRVGKRRITANGTLTLSATVSSPWDRVLDEDLHLSIRPALQPSTTPMQATGEVGWGYPSVVGLALLILCALAFLRLLYVQRQPRLVGTLTVYRDGETLLEANLRGRRARLGKGPLRLSGATLEGSLRPVRRRDEVDQPALPGVKVAAKANGAARRGVIWSGDSLNVGDFEISYTE